MTESAPKSMPKPPLEKTEFERQTMLELQKLRIIESPVMEGRLMGLVRKGIALSMLRTISQTQHDLRRGR